MDLKQLITPLIILLFGVGCLILGSVFKLLHLQFAPQLLFLGGVLQFIAILIAIIRLIKVSRKNNSVKSHL
jgi:hypothetical protein